MGNSCKRKYEGKKEGMFMMKKRVVEILEEIHSGIDYETVENMVTDGVLDSIDVNALIAELEDAFDIEIGMDYMEKKNFDSVDAICKMVEELSK